MELAIEICQWQPAKSYARITTMHVLSMEHAAICFCMRRLKEIIVPYMLEQKLNGPPNQLQSLTLMALQKILIGWTTNKNFIKQVR